MTVPEIYPRLYRDLDSAIETLQHAIEHAESPSQANFLHQEVRRLERRILALANLSAAVSDRLEGRSEAHA